MAQGHPRRLADELAAQIETFGRYGFNKSHSVAYSVLSYQTAWLKAHYPAEFMAALLSSEIGNTDKVVQYINEARELGLEVLPPDVNESGFKFTVVGDRRIRFGLGAVRNVGWGAIESIIAARRDAPFTVLADFVERIDLRLCNKRVLESLVAAGACDSLGGHRKQLIEALESALGEAQLLQQEREAGQASLFGEPQRGGGTAGQRGSTALPDVPRLDRGRAAGEGEGGPRLLHLRASAGALQGRGRALRHPHHRHARRMERAPGEHRRGGDGGQAADLQEDRQGIRPAGAGGLPRHRRGDRLPRRLGQAQPDDRRRRGAAPHRRVQRPRPGRGPRAVHRRVGAADGRAQDLGRGGAEPPLAGARRRRGPEALQAAAALCSAHPGPTPLYIEWSDGNGEAVRLRSRRVRVAAEEDLVRALRDLLGADSVHYVKAG